MQSHIGIRNAHKLVGRKLVQILIRTIRQYLSKISKYILLGLNIQFLAMQDVHFGIISNSN